MYIVLCFRIAFHRPKKSFLIIIEIKLRNCITLKKTLEKTIFLYIIVTGSHGKYLGIDQSIKHELVSSAANT